MKIFAEDRVAVIDTRALLERGGVWGGGQGNAKKKKKKKRFNIPGFLKLQIAVYPSAYETWTQITVQARAEKTPLY